MPFGEAIPRVFGFPPRSVLFDQLPKACTVKEGMFLELANLLRNITKS